MKVKEIGLMTKERLDVLLVNKGLAQSRQRAQSYIMAGVVRVDEKKIDKCGTLVSSTADIKIIGDNIGYVSRGGLKLARAIKEFSIDLTDKVVIDVGASTGGFTDCALKNGAKKVFAIDVGYGQLAWSLRTDERVVNFERTNIRYVTLDDIGEQADFVTIDASFISLEKILPAVNSLLCPNGEVVALIKPQFEAGRENVGKKGVVKDKNVHREVILNIVNCVINLSLYPINITFSPIKGPEGNIEYLLYLTKVKQNENDIVSIEIIDKILSDAHSSL